MPFNMSIAHPHAFVTGQENTRRCIKCGEIKSKSEFLVPPTPAQQKNFNMQPKEIPGIELADGRFIRGYRRVRKSLPKVLTFTCATCRTPAPKLRHPVGSATFQEVMRQIKVKRKNVLAAHLKRAQATQPQSENHLKYWRMTHALLKRAAYLARVRRKHHAKCPPRWELLLSEQERNELSTLHAGVFWKGEAPPIF